jgi:hypothetical protein
MKLNSQRGSILLTTAILGIVMAIAAASYISYAYSAFKRANRAFYYNSAANVAESGAEEALWTLNHAADAPSGWDQRSWATAVVGAKTNKTFTGSIGTPAFTDKNGAKGYYSLYIEDALGTSPKIVVESVINFSTQEAVRKQILLTTSNSSSATPAFVFVDGGKLNGGVIDSYNPALGTYLTAPKGFKATVGSPSVDIGDVTFGAKTEIDGYLSVGIDSDYQTAFIDSLKGKLIGSSITASGDPGVVGSGTTVIDTNRITYDYSATFKNQPAISTFGAQTVLPDPIPGSSPSTIVIDNSTSTTVPLVYNLATLDIPTGTQLVIKGGPVQFVVSGETKVPSSSTIIVTSPTQSANYTTATGTVTLNGVSSTSAEIYATGDVSISGNGSAVGDPTKLTIYGMSTNTATTGPIKRQEITIGGNGSLAATVYAPMANITFDGSGSNGVFAGSVVGFYVTLNGKNYALRYPEGAPTKSGAVTYAVTKWLELTDRSAWHIF